MAALSRVGFHRRKYLTDQIPTPKAHAPNRNRPPLESHLNCATAATTTEAINAAWKYIDGGVIHQSIGHRRRFEPCAYKLECVWCGFKPHSILAKGVFPANPWMICRGFEDQLDTRRFVQHSVNDLPWTRNWKPSEVPPPTTALCTVACQRTERRQQQEPRWLVAFCLSGCFSRPL